MMPESFGCETSRAALTSVPVSKGNYENGPVFSFLISTEMRKSLCYSFKASLCGCTSGSNERRNAVRKTVQSGSGAYHR